MNIVSSTLLTALAYPRAIDEWVQLFDPLYSSREIRAEVVAVRPETADVTTLVLRPNGRWPGHRAGQHVALTSEFRGVRRTRVFSVASDETRSDGRLEITIKASPGGAVTPDLVHRMRRGATVTLSSPQGDFVLPEVLPAKMLFVSGGSGITPVMAMLRTLLTRRHRGDVTFVHYARSTDDVIFQGELETIARTAPPNFRISVQLGRFDATAFAELASDFEQRETWACGPEPFLLAVREAFRARDAESKLHVERFSLPIAAASSEDEEGEVTFARSRIQAKGKGSLLILAEGAGLSPANGCRMGICHTCTCRKVSGITRDLRTGALSTDDDVDIQLCVSAPLGPVELEL